MNLKTPARVEPWSDLWGGGGGGGRHFSPYLKQQNPMGEGEGRAMNPGSRAQPHHPHVKEVLCRAESSVETVYVRGLHK